MLSLLHSFVGGILEKVPIWQITSNCILSPQINSTHPKDDPDVVWLNIMGGFPSVLAPTLGGHFHGGVWWCDEGAGPRKTRARKYVRRN